MREQPHLGRAFIYLSTAIYLGDHGTMVQWGGGEPGAEGLLSALTFGSDSRHWNTVLHGR